MKPIKERFATLAVFLANGFGIGAWAVEVPRIKEHLALSDASLGIALFAFALGAIVAMPLAGRLAPRLGSGRATALLGVAFIAAFPLPALAPNFALLCLVLLLLGAANGALDVSMNGHASAIETVWGSPIMSSFHAAWSAGGLLGAATGAMIQKGGIGVIGGLLLPDVLIGVLIFSAAALALRDIGPRAKAGGGGLALPSAGVMKLAALAFLCMMVEGAVADWRRLGPSVGVKHGGAARRSDRSERTRTRAGLSEHGHRVRRIRTRRHRSRQHRAGHIQLSGALYRDACAGRLNGSHGGLRRLPGGTAHDRIRRGFRGIAARIGRAGRGRVDRLRVWRQSRTRGRCSENGKRGSRCAGWVFRGLG
jgi:hypothetical protein